MDCRKTPLEKGDPKFRYCGKNKAVKIKIQRKIKEERALSSTGEKGSRGKRT